jgi:hypothetical protein
VPAPEKGALTVAREVKRKETVALVNVGSGRIASGCNLYVTLITLAHPCLLTLFVYKSTWNSRERLRVRDVVET